jgi:type IV pilus assembly protein PilY1
VAPEVDVVENGTATGNGFFKDNGYSIIETGNKYYLVDVPDDLMVANYSFSLMADGDGRTPIWTINGKTVTLPVTPSTVIVDEVKDNATNFRYLKNYLNWIFFSGNYAGDGTDLPTKSRFYYAKKALMTVSKLAANQAQFSIYSFTATADGASNVQPLGMVVNTPLAAQPENNTLDSNYVNNINNLNTFTYSPLAEGLATVGGYYGSASSGVVGEYCQKNFAIVISPGVSSEDLVAASQSSPVSLSDYDGDDSVVAIGEGNIKEVSNTYSIPINQNGSTYLDDVAHYLYSNDIVDYQDGFQNVMTYTIGFMGDHLGNLFLKNTSNNGNGNFNLYDTSHEEYGKYHYEAQKPDALSSALLAAVKDILSATSSFTAPVVPVTRTTSGNRIYMAFFKPNESNFWEGNVTKFGIADDNTIIDVNGSPATWPNGAIREDAIAYWQTKDWADPTKSNYISNSDRNIYTYIGYNKDLTASSNEFTAGNSELTEAVLGNPTHTTTEIINYVRGADVFNEDGDSNTTENRDVITGDVLHSEPSVVQYHYPDGTSKTMIYFGANDGMLHAVLDENGTEAWAFIPPDQLHRLKDMVEGLTHQYYVDSSPKAYFHDVDADGIIDTSDGDKIILICGERKGGTSYFALDVTNPDAPKYLWRIDQSNSKTGILELTDIVTNIGGSFQDGDPLRIWDHTLDVQGGWGPDIAAYADGAMSGYLLRYENGTIPFYAGQWVGDLTTATYNDHMNGGTTTPFIWGRIISVTNADPDVIIPELGESWSEPVFGLVKTTGTDTTGTPVFFIGAGYSSDNSTGAAVLAINVFSGQPVKKFKNGFGISGMDFSIASSVTPIDADGNGFVDKVYVGDLGGHMWRIGKFTDTYGNPLSFPESDENITNWSAEILFVSDATYERKFYYPPSITLEKGYDLVFAGTGNREDACDPTSSDRIYSIKDTHTNSLLTESDLVDVTDPAATVPNLDDQNGDVDLNGYIDQGWYVRLAPGEKVLAEGTVFYKTFYLTTFTPNNDPCLPGGLGKIYALEYKTAAAVINFDQDTDLERSLDIGGGIPSKVVTVISDAGKIKLLISVGSTNPDANSESFDAGVVTIDPLTPPINFFYLWWREVLKL